MTPTATYRVQLHAGFPFAAAVEIVPYLARLGVSHLYASPVSTARKGSMHGYDVVDPTRINPELGGEEEFARLSKALRAQGLGLILDIVPNHMAVGGDDNAWWMDVLENGPGSRFADFFDVDWRSPDPALRGKVLAPFLGRAYAEALKAGDIVLEADAEDKIAATAHKTHRFPLRPEDAAALRAEGLERSLAAHDPAREEGRARLHDLLERQHFRLSSWRAAGDAINWRRFFDISTLAGVKVERADVFETLHALPLRLYQEGLVDGLRADHVDGLADPAGYCRTVRERLSALEGRRPAASEPGPAYFVVEKILAPGERLSPAWRTDGTTGYDYMELASALAHDPAGAAALEAAWREISGRASDFGPEERRARRETLERSFSGQLAAAARAFARLAAARTETRDLAEETLRRALVGLLEVFPCYRTYSWGAVEDPEDGRRLGEALRRAAPRAAPGEQVVEEQISAWMLGRVVEADPELAAEATRRFQQLSAPVSAKAVEDTAFYRYSRLISRNDVGFNPARLGIALETFQAGCVERAEALPRSLNATATHDHKRGEDVRARLAVLSEAPEPWIEAASRWRGLNAADASGVDPSDEYVLYQMLAGALPLDLRPDDAGGLDRYRERIEGWFLKALHEAKLRSSWSAPDERYEAGCRRFLERILDPGRSPEFLESLFSFVGRIAPAGVLNGVVQAFLKCVVPGVPDVFQGTEFFDFSLVDPDNRRPVDFAARAAALDRSEGLEEATRDWRSGRVKQAVLAEALALRKSHPELFGAGGHLPLETRSGPSGRILAFVRRLGDKACLVAAPVRCSKALIGGDVILPRPEFWGEAHIELPEALGLGPRLYAQQAFLERPVFHRLIN